MTTLAVRSAQFSKFALVAGCLATACSAASAADVVLIEEHWELRVGGPDESRSAPQVTMVMSPTADTESVFFAFTLNHWSYPQFAAGGTQVQRWQGESCIESTNGDNQATLAQDEEVISWVQRLRLAEGNLIFEIINGNSASWGSFGGNGELALSHSTALARLNNYRPAVSIDQSGIGYAGNRVSSLVLKKLRWQTADGEFHELIAPIDIATDIDP